MEIQGPGYAKPPNEHSCMRLLMILISALMMLIGFAIFIFGVVLYVSDITWVDGTTLLATLLAFGFVIFIIAAIGFCGAFKRSTMWLCLYTCIVFLLLAAKIALVVIIVTGTFEDKFQDFIADRWEGMDDDSKNNIQDHFDCCGYPGFGDDPGPICPTDSNVGCKGEIEDWIEDLEMEIFIGLGVITFIELMMIVMGCCLIRTNRKKSAGDSGYGDSHL